MFSLSSTTDENADQPDAVDELTESSAPSAGLAGVVTLSENVTPDDSPTYKSKPIDIEGMESKTRRALAYGAGIVLAAFYTATFVLHATGVLPELGNVMSMFSGLQTLTAAAFGFYFAKAKGS